MSGRGDHDATEAVPSQPSTPLSMGPGDHPAVPGPPATVLNAAAVAKLQLVFLSVVGTLFALVLSRWH
jgi:hypothetical protein